MAVDPYGRNSKRGVLLNNRTLEMLEDAEMHWLRSFAPVRLTQGSFSTSVGQSAGTHAGGGVFDVGILELTGSQRDSVVWALRKQGFAAWLRNPSQGDWPYHIHAVAIGDKELSAAAKAQVVAYKNGRNGLANNGPDDGPKVQWTEYRQDIDLSYFGPEKWDADDIARMRRIVAGVDIADALTADPDDKMNLDDVLKNDRARLFNVATNVNQIEAKADDMEKKLDALILAVANLGKAPA
jgi:hypothetical protein